MSSRPPFRVGTTTDPSTGRRVLSPPDGITPWDLRSGRFRRLLRGVYVAATAPLTPLLLAQAGLLAAGGKGVVSHHTAARLWGAIVPDDGLIHVTCVGRPRGIGLKAHRPRAGQRGTTTQGVLETTPVDTFLDLSTHLALVDLVVLGDSLVRKGRCTVEQLLEAARTRRGRGCLLARRAAALVRAEVDSPMESRLRLLMVLAGLPEPTVNHKVRWADGTVRFRFDLSYPSHGVAIEYDGRQHAESDEQWDHDIDRREWMDGNGVRLVVVRSKDVHRTPARTLGRITGVMRARGMRVPRLSDEWRRHFPSLPGDVAVPA